MVVTYYTKLFRMGADRHNLILMSLLLPVVETIIHLNHKISETWSIMHDLLVQNLMNTLHYCDHIISPPKLLLKNP